MVGCIIYSVGFGDLITVDGNSEKTYKVEMDAHRKHFVLEDVFLVDAVKASHC